MYTAHATPVMERCTLEQPGRSGPMCGAHNRGHSVIRRREQCQVSQLKGAALAMETCQRTATTVWLHARRTARGDRHHRNSGCALVTGGASQREAARRFQCSNNLKQWALGSKTTTTYNAFPFGRIDPAAGGYRWSVQASVLPYIEQGNIYANLDFSNPNGQGDPLIYSARFRSTSAPRTLTA